IQVGDYTDSAHATKLTAQWSVHHAGGVYPGSWARFLPTIYFEMPPANVSSAALYLFKTEINGPNMPPRYAWWQLCPTQRQPWEISRLSDEDLDAQRVEQFWATYHSCRSYLELDR
ncbi:MAG TPA: hypothetical protein VMT24_19970, partial [Aggregatilineaceae bacterium]|nr:hypothetical protein [Aggregatilineaceae bacterium]